MVTISAIDRLLKARKRGYKAAISNAALHVKALGAAWALA
jgi:hypothetical protein